ncbi:Rv3654c family TadE-like protein [Streptomyces sp. NPDC001822]|uniref:Rv3654c family TadE-like protein n=1 Tax=Streptomyces sp. NPDC001822 TaxID=3364614 RepID=UPI0036B23163
MRPTTVHGTGAGRKCGGFRAGDEGLATVWVAMTTTSLCVVFAVLLALGQAVSARHRAGGAADLAALAAADRALHGPDEACDAAREVAVAQEAELVRCSVLGEIADVTARAGFGPYRPEARSRAGPPEAAAPTERSSASVSADIPVRAGSGSPHRNPRSGSSAPVSRRTRLPPGRPAMDSPIRPRGPPPVSLAGPLLRGLPLRGPAVRS